MKNNRKQALLITFAIIDHIARTNVIMDEDKELEELNKKRERLEKQDWGFYGGIHHS